MGCLPLQAFWTWVPGKLRVCDAPPGQCLPADLMSATPGYHRFTLAVECFAARAAPFCPVLWSGFIPSSCVDFVILDNCASSLGLRHCTCLPPYQTIRWGGETPDHTKAHPPPPPHPSPPPSWLCATTVTRAGWGHDPRDGPCFRRMGSSNHQWNLWCHVSPDSRKFSTCGATSHLEHGISSCHDVVLCMTGIVFARGWLQNPVRTGTVPTTRPRGGGGVGC